MNDNHLYMEGVISLLGDHITDPDPMTYETQRILAYMPYPYYSKILGLMGKSDPMQQYPMYTMYKCDLSMPYMEEITSLVNIDPDEQDIPSMTLTTSGVMLMKLPMPSCVKSVLDTSDGRYIVFPVLFAIDMVSDETKNLETDKQVNVPGHIGLMLFDKFLQCGELVDPNGYTSYFGSFLDPSVTEASEIPLHSLIDHYVAEYIQKVDPTFNLVSQETRANYNINRIFTDPNFHSGNCKICVIILYRIFQLGDLQVDDVLSSLFHLSDPELYGIISRFASSAMMLLYSVLGDDEHFQQYICRQIPIIIEEEENAKRFALANAKQNENEGNCVTTIV
jgi:hypothetical protein